MKLTKKDKQYLLKIGIKEHEFSKIEKCATYTKYEMFHVDNESIVTKIGRKKVIEILGREHFLNGLARSTFHCSSARYNEDYTICVIFDSEKYFKF